MSHPPPSEGASGRSTAVWYTIGRYLLAGILLSYAASKVVGLQFLVSDTALDTRLRDLRGIDLTWAFYGTSSALHSGTVLAEAGAAGLLLWRRTARLGVLVTLVMLAHLLLINIGHSIPALGMVLFMGLVAGLMFGADWPAFCRYAFTAPDVGTSGGGPADGAAGRPALARPPWVKALVGVVVVGVAVAFNLWQRQLNAFDAEVRGVWAFVDDPDLQRFYMDEGPTCGVQPHDSAQIWKGICHLDDEAGTLHGQLTATPEPTAETMELDVSYHLEVDATRLVLVDHVRGRQAELTRLR